MAEGSENWVAGQGACGEAALALTAALGAAQQRRQEAGAITAALPHLPGSLISQVADIDAAPHHHALPAPAATAVRPPRRAAAAVAVGRAAIAVGVAAAAAVGVAAAAAAGRRAAPARLPQLVVVSVLPAGCG